MIQKTFRILTLTIGCFGCNSSDSTTNQTDTHKEIIRHSLLFDFDISFADLPPDISEVTLPNGNILTEPMTKELATH